ncbi:hypothetical protein B0H19DRAFT_1275890 [Mycena capillaripes]|nr:hypothetical protein B0H19DRAFT_1275890 [Mycena capillaripes]
MPAHYNVLNQLINLTSCRLHMCRLRVGEALPDIILPRVETFILLAFPFYILPHALNALTFPALRRLQHKNFAGGLFNPVETVAALISRSGCSLQELCVPGSPYTEDEYRRCDGFPSVVSFIFEVDGKLDIKEPFLKEWRTQWNEGEDAESEDDEQVA